MKELAMMPISLSAYLRKAHARHDHDILSRAFASLHAMALRRDDEARSIAGA